VPVEGRREPVLVTEGAPYHAAWGDDGTIYFTTAAGAGGLHAVPAGGGKERLLAMPRADKGESMFASPEPLPDGSVLFTAIGPSGGYRQTKLLVISGGGGEPALVTEGGSAGRFVHPDALIYLNTSGKVVVRPFDARAHRLSGDAQPVADGIRVTSFGAVPHVAVSRQGTLVYYSGSDFKKRVLVERDEHATPLRRLMDGSNFIPSAGLSPDRRTIAGSIFNGDNPDLFSFDLESGALRRLTFDDAEDEGPVWSADGKQFISSRGANGGARLAVVESLDAAQPPRVLFRRPEHFHVHAWSTDGKWVVYNSFNRDTGRSDMWMVALDSPETSRPIAQDAYVADLSRDGRWLAYCARESSTHQVFVVSFPELANKRQVSRDGGCFPRWSPEGTALYFFDRAAWDVQSQMLVAHREGASDWRPPVGLFRAEAGFFAVRDHPLRFYLSEINPAEIATEIRVVVGWNHGAK
jgi:Tol biopolymer transport system component